VLTVHSGGWLSLEYPMLALWFTGYWTRWAVLMMWACLLSYTFKFLKPLITDWTRIWLFMYAVTKEPFLQRA